MGISDKDIDQLFKDNLTDLNLTFDPTYWGKLEEKLEKKKRRKFFWIFFLSGVIMTGVAFTNLNFNKANQLDYKNTYEGHSSSDNNHTREIGKHKSPKFKSKEKVAKLMGVNSIKAIKVTQKSFVKNSELITTNSLAKKNNSLVNEKVKSTFQSPFSKKIINKNTVPLKVLSKENEIDTPEDKKKIYKIEKIHLRSFEFLSEGLKTNFNPAPPITTSQSHLREFCFGVEIYPNINYVFNNPSSQIGKRKRSEEYGKNINFGINYTYYHTKNIDFIIGLNYARYSHSVGFYINNIDSSGLVLSPSQPPPSSSPMLVKENNEFHFVKIRFDFNYYFSRKKWSPYLSLAPALNYNVLSKSTLTYDGNSYRNEVKSKLLSPTLNIGLGLNHSFTTNWNLYLQPNFEFHLTPTVYSTPKKFTTPFSFGLKVGLRKKWKNNYNLK